MLTQISWEVLQATWEGLSALMENYEPAGEGWATLCEARRLTEHEMHQQGYEEEWAELTGNEREW